MAQLNEQDFFGGAIRGVVPQRWIDGRSVYPSPMFNTIPFSLDHTFLDSIHNILETWTFPVILLDPASRSISLLSTNPKRQNFSKVNILTSQ